MSSPNLNPGLNPKSQQTQQSQHYQQSSGQQPSKPLDQNSQSSRIVEHVPTFILDSAVPILSESVDNIKNLRSNGPYPQMTRPTGPRKSFSVVDKELSNAARVSVSRSVSVGQPLSSTSFFLNTFDTSSTAASTNNSNNKHIGGEKKSSSLNNSPNINDSSVNITHPTLDPLAKIPPLPSTSRPKKNSISNNSSSSSSSSSTSSLSSSFATVDHSPTNSSLWKNNTQERPTIGITTIYTNSSASTSHRNVQVIQSPHSTFSPLETPLQHLKQSSEYIRRSSPDLERNIPEFDKQHQHSNSEPLLSNLHKSSISSVSSSGSSTSSSGSSTTIAATAPVTTTTPTQSSMATALSISNGNKPYNSPQFDPAHTPSITQQANFSPLSPSTNLVPRSRNASGQQHITYPNPMQCINFRANDPNEWTLERVISWLEFNKFGPDWIDTFRSRNIYGKEFLSLVSYQKLKDLGHLSATNDIYSTTPSRFIHILRKVFDRSSSNPSSGTPDPSLQQDFPDEESSTYNMETFYSSVTGQEPVILDSKHSSSNGPQTDHSSLSPLALPLPTTNSQSSTGMPLSGQNIMRLPVKNKSYDNLSEIDPVQVRVRARNQQLRPLSTTESSQKPQVCS